MLFYKAIQLQSWGGGSLLLHSILTRPTLMLRYKERTGTRDKINSGLITFWYLAVAEIDLWHQFVSSSKPI